MVLRYDNADTFVNNNRIYKNIFKDRGVNQITQFGTRNLNFPTIEQLTELNIIAHTWTYGDRYFRLAHENYGDPRLWWVIAFFNQNPTESTLTFGSIVYIPHPIERILNIYGV